METAQPQACRNVIIIDDDPLVRDFIVHTLEFGINRKVIALDSGSEGWRYLQDQSLPVDIVIADANIPDLNGLDLLERAKKIYPGIAFAIVSSDPRDERRARLLKADAFVAKPFNVDDLITLMRNLIPVPSRVGVPEASLKA
jgi:DNA-binding NarL/FixJ family response regulator